MTLGQSAQKVLAGITIAVVLQGAPALRAQETTGTIDGRVTDSLGVPLPGVIVVVSSPSLPGQRGGVTNREGLFRLPALPIGRYDVRLSHLSHRGVRLEGVNVRLGATSSLGTVRLQTGTFQLPEVTVTASQLRLESASTTTGGNLMPAEFNALPVQRTYDRIIALLPQANESYLGDAVNVAGSTGMENKYFIDGVDVSDTYRGLGGGSLPYNIIREIEVKSGAYEAEYRSTLGGVVNVVTYSGGNDVTGKVFGYFTNNDLAGTPRGGTLEPATGEFAQYDVGFGIGGPIVRDRLWYFLAYSPMFQNTNVTVPGLGEYPDRTTAHIFAGNMSWRMSDRDFLLLSISGDPTKRDAVGQTFGEFGTPATFLNPDPYLGDATLGGVGARMKGTHILSDASALEFSLSWMQRNDRYMPATDVGAREPLFIDMTTATWSGGYPMRVDNQSTVAGGRVRGSWTLRDHTLKGGIEYTDTRLDASFSVSIVQRFSPFAYAAVNYSSQGTLHNRVPSVFFQDSWAATPWLTVNAGLRWDGQYIVGSDGHVAQRVLGQWQPRAGVVLRPSGGGTDRISASYGRYMQDLLMYASTLYHIAGATQSVIAYPQDPRVTTAGGIPRVNVVSTIQREIDGMRGQGFDEFTLGYEREISGGLIAGVRGTYRTLLDAVEDGEDPTEPGTFYLANPGRTPLVSFPRPKRTYAGAELTLRTPHDANPWVFASYVLSRNEGNYPGLFNSDFEIRLPNANKSFDYVENLVNADGRLPNDRTHVVKVSGSYRFGFDLTVGAFILWQSGTPLSEFGGSKAGGFNYNFLRQRGTAGTTSSIWDVNLRLAYDLPDNILQGIRTRLIADLFHIGSSRKPVDYEQIHYFNVDENGNQIDPNPLYGEATTFQPPMSLRFGLEVGF